VERTLRQKAARSLRKWADLIDPRVKPTSDGPTVTVNVETVGFDEVEARTKELKARLEELVSLGDRLKGSVV
jgi:hypothetical protein